MRPWRVLPPLGRSWAAFLSQLARRPEIALVKGIQNRLPPEEWSQDRTLSFGSIPEALGHVIDVEDYDANHIRRRKTARGPDRSEVNVECVRGRWGDVEGEHPRMLELPRACAPGVHPRRTFTQATGHVAEWPLMSMIHEVYHVGEVLDIQGQRSVERPLVDSWLF